MWHDWSASIIWIGVYEGIYYRILIGEEEYFWSGDIVLWGYRDCDWNSCWIIF